LKHDWNTFENYIRVHEKVLRDYSNYFFTQNPTYKEERVTDNYYTLELDRLGLITNKGTRVYIKVEKDIHVKAGARKPIAKLYEYSYHAWDSVSKRNLLRYCSPHEDHNRFHHRHDYSENPMITTQVADDEWPHVSEFFDELINSF